MIWNAGCERRQPGAPIEQDVLIPLARNLTIPFTLAPASDPHVSHATLPLAYSGGRRSTHPRQSIVSAD